ncbi:MULTISPECIES: arsenic resistance protein [Comamonas]|jgi:ACR3 family arsenite transporter|uniref:arsenic resistance protein n=1 Tax=Comamonas TaxID=283 RepID=UPI002579D23B|nr:MULTISPECIES: arsenic resistance protein [Comamonas]
MSLRDVLERWQAPIYLVTVVLAAVFAWQFDGMQVLEVAINPALALMLYVTFLQVPWTELRAVWVQGRFLLALLVTNFVAIPLLVGVLSLMLPSDDLLRFGVLLVLLAPCIDYVVTFAHMGKADARLLLACTPVLLVVQMLLLPFYIEVMLGSQAADWVQLGAFVDAFIGLIVAPLVLAVATQWWAQRSSAGQRWSAVLALLPVPATAMVLFVVMAAVVPQLGAAPDAVRQVLPVYVAFAVLAPAIAWCVAQLFKLPAPAARAVAFSGSTRNSLVVLPLALAVPGAMPVLPAVIVAQTLVELLSELVYIQLMPRLR